MHENMLIRGRLKLSVTDRSGRVVHRQERPNRIMKTGRDLVAHLFTGVPDGLPPAPVTHVAIGTSNADAGSDVPALRQPRGAPIPITEVTYGVVEEPAGGGGGATVQRTRASLTAVVDYADGNGIEPLLEAGLLTSGGVLYNRVVFDPVTKTDAFKLTVLWDVVF